MAQKIVSDVELVGGARLTGLPVATDPDEAVSLDQVANLIAAAGGGGGAATYSVLIGDAAATSIVVTHSLNNKQVAVTVAEAAAPFSIVMAEVELTTDDTITVKFATAPAANFYRVTVIGQNIP